MTGLVLVGIAWGAAGLGWLALFRLAMRFGPECEARFLCFTGGSAVGAGIAYAQFPL